jgi:hypothetical protein
MYNYVKGVSFVMPVWLINILAAIGSILLSLTVSFLFNKLVGLPKAIKAQKAAEQAEKEQLRLENCERDRKIAELKTAVDALPGYRAQSLQIQAQLQGTDREILSVCNDIKNGVLENQGILNERLDRLERREKNAIRAKLIDEYRLFTDEMKNPMLAWSEMEHHAFFALVHDYEDLHGNDYVHDTVLPAMNDLEVVPMSDKPRLLALMNSRRL